MEKKQAEIFCVIQTDNQYETIAAEFESEEDAMAHLEFLQRFWIDSPYTFYVLEKELLYVE